MSLRRDPAQGRSREMYNQILLSAKALIVEKGDVDVSMREIASHAGVAPSSVYQYFESRDQVLLKIVESYFDDAKTYLRSLPPLVKDEEQLITAVDAAVNYLFSLYSEEPALIVIMDRIKRNPILTEMDVSGSKKNSAVIAKQILEAFPQLDTVEVKAVSDLLTHLVGWGVRYAASVKNKRKQQETLKHLKSMIVFKIASFVSS